MCLSKVTATGAWGIDNFTVAKSKSESLVIKVRLGNFVNKNNLYGYFLYLIVNLDVDCETHLS